jgi:hypothetical protein
LAVLFRSFGYLLNHLALSVPDEGYLALNVPDEGYLALSVPDEGYFRNVSCTLNLTSIFSYLFFLIFFHIPEDNFY